MAKRENFTLEEPLLIVSIRLILSSSMAVEDVGIFLHSFHRAP
jgi:hypothetical protein